jgi:hypothetical protein
MPDTTEPTGWESSGPRPQGTDGPDRAGPARRFWDLWRQGQRPVVADFLARAGINAPARIVPVLRVDQAERCALGDWVPAEAYLEAFPCVKADLECAIDLVFAEYLLREERGERPSLEEFRGRFPQYADELKVQIQWHAAIRATGATAASVAEDPVTMAVEDGPGPATVRAGYPSIPGYEILGEVGRAAWAWSTGPGRAS